MLMQIIMTMVGIIMIKKSYREFVSSKISKFFNHSQIDSPETGSYK